MQRFKKKKLLAAILASGIFSNLSHALSYTDAVDLSFWLGSTSAGFSLSSAGYVPENSHLESNDFLWIRNLNTTGADQDTALFLLDKNSSLTYLHNNSEIDGDGFRNSIISSYTGSQKSGIAVEIGSNSFSSEERPNFFANNTDFFADKTGLKIRSGVVKLSGVSISALDKGVDISDMDSNGPKGAGSQLGLDNFSIKFDAERFNKLVEDQTGSSPKFTDAQKTKTGVSIGGTGVKGETVVTLINGEIDTVGPAVSAFDATHIYIDRVKMNTTQYPGSSTISVNGQDTYVSVTNSEIKTRSSGVQASAAEVDIDNVLIERTGYGFGVVARYGGKISLSNSTLTLTGGTQSGNDGFTSAAVAVREKDSKITLSNVMIEDHISNLTMMKGIYADMNGEVDGSKVKYKSASSGALGVQIADKGKVSLKDSVFELTGAGSIGVFSGGGTFNADHSAFTSKGTLIRIYKYSGDDSYINLKNNSDFLSSDVLLRSDTADFDAFLTADNSLLAGRINGGFTTDVNLNNKSEWSYSGISSFRNFSIDNSIVRMNKPNAGKYNVLEVDKLHGQNATIQLWTEFSGDASVSDIIRISVEASGKTGLSFKKSGGTGEQTGKGIKVVDAVDASPFGPVAVTAADAFFIHASSDGYRQGKGTIAAGAYEYALKKGGGNADESWYLQSVKINDPGLGPEPLPRPEVDIYFANRASMLNMQQHHLKQRVMDGWQSPVAWVRMDHKQERFNNQLDNQRKSDMNLVHFGLDMLRKDLGAQGVLQAGVMGLIGQNKSKLRNDIGNARGKTDGYNLGAYASWFQNRDGNTGAYVDSWLMHGWFNNSTQGDGLGEEKYKSRALSLSLEAGYGFRLPWGDDDHRYTLQPQAQVILSHLHSDNVDEKTKTQVRHDNGGQASYRMGVRFQGDSKQANGSVLSPFAELNFWHQPQAKDIRFDSKAISDKTPSTITEAVLGVKMRVKPNWDVSGQFNYQQGSQSYKQKIVQLGARYQW